MREKWYIRWPHMDPMDPPVVGLRYTAKNGELLMMWPVRWEEAALAVRELLGLNRGGREPVSEAAWSWRRRALWRGVPWAMWQRGKAALEDAGWDFQKVTDFRRFGS